MPDTIGDELSGACFGDTRLTKRLGKIANQFQAKPNMSIPAATGNRAEMEAAYRFFDNPKVTPQAIVQPHVEATVHRARERDAVLMVQDTTELDLTRPEQQIAGAGPLDFNSRCGVYYHPLIAFAADGLPLGTVWSKSWARDNIETELTADEKSAQRKQVPIEDKESIRWVEGLRAAREFAELCPQTECISVSDSESDIYELLSESRATSQGELHLVIRACQDRAISNSQDHLLAAVRDTDCLYECSVDVSPRKDKMKFAGKKRGGDRPARIAEVEVRATTVTLRPPYRPDRKLPAITINVVLVEETNPPPGQTPVQWILLTTLPVDEVEQVQRVVAYYCIRWQIEVYFRTLKSGCRIESRYFERIGRLMNCLAVYSIVAWKVLYLCRLSRECPDLDCEVVFEPSEWQPVCMAVRNGNLPPTQPTLNEMVRMVASLGGYVIRKSTQPGTQTLWLGLQRLHDLSMAWNIFGPGD